MTLGSDIEVMARTIWGEARGQTYAGMMAVGWAIKNRSTDQKRRWPVTIEKVCKQRWQFSCWNPGDPNLQKLLAVDVSSQSFGVALRAAVEVIVGKIDMVKGANHYLTVELAEDSPPAWYDESKVVCEIGDHRFLKL